MIVIDAANSGHLFAALRRAYLKRLTPAQTGLQSITDCPVSHPAPVFKLTSNFWLLIRLTLTRCMRRLWRDRRRRIRTIKTVDGGATWTLTESVFATGSAISASAPGTLYAGATNTGEIFSTTDGGLNWIKKKSPGVGVRVNCMLIDQTNPNTVYIGSDGRIIKSTDAGNTWQFIPLSDTGVQPSIYTLSATPGSPNTIWAGTGSGVVRSIDAVPTGRTLIMGFRFFFPQQRCLHASQNKCAGD